MSREGFPPPSPRTLERSIRQYRVVEGIQAKYRMVVFINRNEDEYHPNTICDEPVPSYPDMSFVDFNNDGDLIEVGLAPEDTGCAERPASPTSREGAVVWARAAEEEQSEQRNGPRHVDREYCKPSTHSDAEEEMPKPAPQRRKRKAQGAMDAPSKPAEPKETKWGAAVGSGQRPRGRPSNKERESWTPQQTEIARERAEKRRIKIACKEERQKKQTDGKAVAKEQSEKKEKKSTGEELEGSSSSAIPAVQPAAAPLEASQFSFSVPVFGSCATRNNDPTSNAQGLGDEVRSNQQHQLQCADASQPGSSPFNTTYHHDVGLYSTLLNSTLPLHSPQQNWANVASTYNPDEQK
ncbi:hypothetical protein BDV96DRAFT_603416 [Lophiotrema nucula]|uniref:Uncharacterized protein n=1 Tax=Lophiotrema nucula TaxID=690887 RepID=A0A6A5YW53_9PLEO|nr:hypothetical protein BDV96DRAFT_603416 [Lophiotrema nucula]